MAEQQEQKPSDKRWWGEFDLEPGRWARWTIGPKQFLARALENEWRFAWQTSDDLLSESVAFEPVVNDDEVSPEFSFRRYAVENAGSRLKIVPRLSDRAVIVRPETPLYLPPNQRATLYVSTGVWLSVAPAATDTTEFFEIPVYRGSDTWFGPDTVNGELCYASITNARTEIELLAQVPHRAFTPVDITNNGSDALEIEALRVPVPLLSIYVGSNGRLWTEQITFEREQGETAASLRISDHEALESTAEQRLSGPRDTQQGGIVHSFSRIFGKSDS